LAEFVFLLDSNSPNDFFTPESFENEKSCENKSADTPEKTQIKPNRVFPFYAHLQTHPLFYQYTYNVISKRTHRVNRLNGSGIIIGKDRQTDGHVPFEVVDKKTRRIPFFNFFAY
jgi:hypothetical protein